ncbi:hypothetical protein OOZ15_13630 [Galbibacter sp. EGI 63066]|uniref:hypothetical protein n=1 Tax=Galbibacter sp. EGI 63066 TaxID=2993559 RepID=UPI00224953C2|nr:hypothetical protein [Galbibacter sp. EGI 63066]MCX2680989.1 hypothetical protein [Galbibacter sp. EGI 63066]
MKRLLITLLLFSVTHAGAQNWDEWFNQKDTQRKYLLQQIVAFKIYLGYAQKGYRVVDRGLTMIGDIRNGEFRLHEGFFDELKSVNPVVRDYARIKDIARLQAYLVSERQHAYRALEQSGQFSLSELQAIREVHGRVLSGSTRDLDRLLGLLTPGKLEMSDAERLGRIDVIYDSMLKRYRYLRDYNSRGEQLAENRLREKTDGRAIEILH